MSNRKHKESLQSLLDRPEESAIESDRFALTGRQNLLLSDQEYQYRNCLANLKYAAERHFFSYISLDSKISQGDFNSYFMTKTNGYLK